MADEKLQHINLEKELREIGEYSVNYLKKLLKEGDKNASHQLTNSITFKIKGTGQGMILHILADPHFKYVDQGRFPFRGKEFKPDYRLSPAGKFVPYKPLENWIKQRGIFSDMKPKAAAFLISRAIAYRGIKPLDMLEKLETELTKTLTERIVNASKRDIQELINRIYYL